MGNASKPPHVSDHFDVGAGTPYDAILPRLNNHMEDYISHLVSEGKRESTAMQYGSMIRSMYKNGDIRDDVVWKELVSRYSGTSRSTRNVARRSYMEWIGMLYQSGATAAALAARSDNASRARILASLRRSIDSYIRIWEAGLVQVSVVDFVKQEAAMLTARSILAVDEDPDEEPEDATDTLDELDDVAENAEIVEGTDGLREQESVDILPSGSDVGMALKEETSVEDNVNMDAASLISKLTEMIKQKKPQGD